MNDMFVYEGKIAVKAALESGKREIARVMVDAKSRDKDTAYIKHLCAVNGVDFTPVSRADIDATATGRSHGGVIMLASSRKYDDVSSLCEKEDPLIFLFEGIEDPFNLAHAIRSVCAAGCDGVILSGRDWSYADPTLLKASAGAFDRLPVVCPEDIASALDALRSKGIRILCADRNDADPLFSSDLCGGIVIAIGGELRGLSSAVSIRGDKRIFIPYGSNFRNSLTATASASVFAFEALRQRSK